MGISAIALLLISSPLVISKFLGLVLFAPLVPESFLATV
jgi:hypothetical protein